MQFRITSLLPYEYTSIASMHILLSKSPRCKPERQQ